MDSCYLSSTDLNPLLMSVCNSLTDLNPLLMSVCNSLGLSIIFDPRTSLLDIRCYHFCIISFPQSNTNGSIFGSTKARKDDACISDKDPCLIGLHIITAEMGTAGIIESQALHKHRPEGG